MALLGLTLSDLLGGGGNAAPTTSASLARTTVTAPAPTIATSSIAAVSTASSLAALPASLAPPVVGQVGANLGPLTTTFTPPAACSTAVAACATCASALLGQSCNAAGSPVDAASCWPSITGAVASPSAPFHGLGFYSPGVACPNGYASACSATAGASSGWPLQFNLAASETAVGCCPNGYQCGNAGGQTCIQVAVATAVPTVACGSGKFGAAGLQQVPDKAAAITAYTLFAPMIQLNFKSSDLAGGAAGAVPAKSTSKPANTLVTSITSASAASGTASSASADASVTSDNASAPTTLLVASSGALETAGGAMTGGTMVVPIGSTPATDSDTAATADANLSTSTPPPVTQSNTVSTPVRVGAAIGGGVGVIAIIVGAICLNRRLWRERRNKARDSMMMKLSEYDPNATKPTFFTEPDLLPGGRGRRTFMMGGDSLRGYRV